ncbi:hypothetical protein ACTDI4_18025 [Mesorhizobium sp. PUT5]
MDEKAFEALTQAVRESKEALEEFGRNLQESVAALEALVALMLAAQAGGK